MNRKAILVLVGLGILIIAFHLIAANILSNQIEEIVRNRFMQTKKGSGSVQEVTIQPFRGNITIQDFAYGVKNTSYRFDIGQAGVDLTYFQLWQFYFQQPIHYIASLDQIPLTASYMRFSNQDFRVDIAESYITAFPSSRTVSGSKASLQDRLSEKLRLDIKMQGMSWRVKNPLSTPLMDSIKPHNLIWSRVKSQAVWIGSNRSLQIDTLTLQSPEAQLELQAALQIKNKADQLILSSLDFSMSYNPDFSIQFSKKQGSFSGVDLSWQINNTNPLKPSNFVASIGGGRHKIKLKQFSWIPPADIRNKLHSIPGGQTLFKKGISGNDLNLTYSYDPRRHAMQLQNLSFSTRHYQFQAQGRLTIDPAQPRNGFIRNIHITLDELSDPLTQVLHQFENAFGVRIFKASDESIELYLQGRFTDPEWKLL